MPDGSAVLAAENEGGIGMLKRTISGAVLILIMIGLMYAGGNLLLIGLLAMSLIGLWEFCHAVSTGGHKPYLYLGMAGTLFYYGLIWSAIENVWSSAIFLLYIVVFLMALMIRSVMAYPERRVEDGALTLMGFLYVPVLFSFLYFLREQDDGIFYVWYVFLASWGCDTCAYLAGRFFGKHKMSPHPESEEDGGGSDRRHIGSHSAFHDICVLYPFLCACGQCGTLYSEFLDRLIRRVPGAAGRSVCLLH